MIGLSRRKLIISGVSIAVILTAIVAVVLIVSLGNNDSENGSTTNAASYHGVYKKAAVSTNGPECAQIGASMLARGGSAVDAAIAALLCEGVASLHSMGLGGGFLMTIWDANTKTADYLDARETAPAKADKDMFKGDPDLATYGGLAVAVPGELMGYWEAHKKYGKLAWSELFEPTISLCETGSIVTKYLQQYLDSKEERIKKEKSLAEILINPRTNSTWKEGDKIKRPQLKKTLQEIANLGPSVFYNGTMGDELVREIKAFNGIIEKEDLRNYKVKWRKPINTTLGVLTIYTAPPPGSGAILAFILNVLHGMMPIDNENYMWQTIVETFKWAYARRHELGDPDYVDGDYIAALLANLTSMDYAKEVRGKIKVDKTFTDPKYYGAVTVTPDDHGTSHISVLAPDGSAVSATSTINQVFGAMIRSRSTGIIFNDEMDDFSSPNMTNGFDLPPSPHNYIKPGKRPMSSMSPTIILDNKGDVRLVIGAAGGTKIISSVAIATVLNILSGYHIQAAVEAPRLHHQLFPMIVQNENRFSPTVLSYLRSVGHNVTAYTGIGSAITAIAKEHGQIVASSDFRRQGKTAGF